MARSGFLVENEYRAYPFVDAGAGVPLPEDAVVDFGCLMGLDAGHVDGVDAVRLHRVTRAGGAVRFEFRAAAAGAADYPLAFVVPEDAAEFETFEAEADLAPGSAGSSTSSASPVQERALSPSMSGAAAETPHFSSNSLIMLANSMTGMFDKKSITSFFCKAILKIS
jgi:hypothetical protein